jgi:hypothetical protein
MPLDMRMAEVVHTRHLTIRVYWNWNVIWLALLQTCHSQPNHVWVSHRSLRLEDLV